VTFATRTTRLSLLFLTISSLARPQGLSPGACSKEYIRQGSQIIAIESPRVQFITFGAVGDQIAGTPFTLSASASSGLALSYTSSTPSVCTVSTDAATFIAAGTYTITAEQSGNATYPAAPPVSQSFNVVAVVSAQVTSTGFAYSRVTRLSTARSPSPMGPLRAWPLPFSLCSRG
jgi:Flp pilus assembly secretin CpaC